MVDLIPVRLTNLLEQERIALTQADFDQLNRLGPEKGDLLSRLSRSAPGSGQLQKIADQIQRNQVLLAATLRGLRSAKLTVAGRDNVLSRSIIYGKNGEISKMETGAKSMSQKF